MKRILRLIHRITGRHQWDCFVYSYDMRLVEMRCKCGSKEEFGLMGKRGVEMWLDDRGCSQSSKPQEER